MYSSSSMSACSYRRTPGIFSSIGPIRHRGTGPDAITAATTNLNSSVFGSSSAGGGKTLTGKVSRTSRHRSCSAGIPVGNWRTYSNWRALKLQTTGEASGRNLSTGARESRSCERSYPNRPGLAEGVENMTLDSKNRLTRRVKAPGCFRMDYPHAARCGIHVMSLFVALSNQCVALPLLLFESERPSAFDARYPPSRRRHDSNPAVTGEMN